MSSNEPTENQEIESEVTIVSVPVDELKPNTYNPNQQNVDDFDLLVKSIEEDGFTLPVVVNSGETDAKLHNVIIDGEHRWRAAQVLGMPAVPVIYKDMDEGTMRASTLRHNKARGKHDAMLESKVLADLVGEIGADELSSSLNLDPVELDVMMSKALDFTSLEDLAALGEDDALETLAGRNVTGDNAQIVAKRHAMIDSKNALSQQNSNQLANEAGKTVRVELIYHGDDAEFMRKFVGQFTNSREAILSLCSQSE